jgi:hypothetical protein
MVECRVSGVNMVIWIQSGRYGRVDMDNWIQWRVVLSKCGNRMEMIDGTW